MELVLDTNFWIYLAKYRLFDKLKGMRIELILLEPVKRELESLSRSGKEGTNASVALEMIKRWDIKAVPSKERDADDAILKFAAENKAHKRSSESVKVATMDKELSERLKKEGIQTMKIRQERDFLE